MNDLRKTIEWFKENLQYQLEDFALERAKKRILFYFDAHEVLRAARGYKDYYKFDEFNSEKFFDQVTLVCSLASSGMLGEIRMLPPHQDEFLKKVKARFDVGVIHNWSEEAEEFSKDAGFPTLLTEELPNLNSLSEDALLKFLTEQAERAKREFSVIQCLLPWHRRLVTWFENGRLFLDKQRPDYTGLLASNHFLTLKKAFEAVRPELYYNNFSDALALSALIKMTEDFNTGKKDIIPRLYSPPSFDRKNTINSILEKTELISKLEYSVDGHKSSVLRGSDYFIFKVICRPNKSEDDVFSESDLRNLYDVIANIPTSNLTPQYLSKIDFAGKSLLTLIEEMTNLLFLKRVWMRFIKSGDLEAVLQELNYVKTLVEEANRRVYENEAFQKGVLDVLEGTHRGVFDNLEDIRLASTLWEPLNHAVSPLRKQVINEQFDDQNLFGHFGLIRYGFPSKTRERMISILRKLLSNDEELTQQGYVDMLGAFFRGRENPRMCEDDLIVATALLLAANFDDRLYTLLSKAYHENRRYMHYSLRTIYADVLFRQKRCAQGIRTITDLEQTLNSKSITTLDRRYLSIGLAYLSFHAWKCKENNPIWRPPYLAPNQEDAVLISKAIKFAKNVYKGFGEKEFPAERVYALNQVLYYLVEGTENNYIGEMKEYAILLVSFKNKEGWQFRYDDTLARYYHRLATLADSHAEWQLNLQNALNHIQDAKKNSDGDPLVDGYESLLRAYESNGFSRPRS